MTFRPTQENSCPHPCAYPSFHSCLPSCHHLPPYLPHFPPRFILDYYVATCCCVGSLLLLTLPSYNSTFPLPFCPYHSPGLAAATIASRYLTAYILAVGLLILPSFVYGLCAISPYRRDGTRVDLPTTTCVPFPSTPPQFLLLLDDSITTRRVR